MSFSFQPCILSHCSFSPRFLHESSRIFEEKKLQFGCFSYRKTPELQFFLLKERISSGFARANLNSRPKSTTIWAFDSCLPSNAQIVVLFGREFGMIHVRCEYQECIS